MACYLITGVAGFIGASVADHLLEDGHRVVGLDNLNDAYDVRMKNWRLDQLGSHEDFTFHRVDIVDAATLEKVGDDEAYDAVINLAARAGVRQSLRDPLPYVQTNVVGTLNLLKLCSQRKVPKFVQASTSSLYGDHNPRPFREDADTNRPISPYAATKGAAELLCHTYHSLYDLDITILRYFTVYGPAGRPDMSIFRFVQWIAEGKPVVIYGDGLQERDFTYVDDVAYGTVAALRPLGFEIVNLGGDQPTKVNDVIQKIASLLGKQASLDYRGKFPGDLHATWADVQKAKSLLEWEPKVGLDEGLQICVDWYLAEQDWARHIDTSQ